MIVSQFPREKNKAMPGMFMEVVNAQIVMCPPSVYPSTRTGRSLFHTSLRQRDLCYSPLQQQITTVKLYFFLISKFIRSLGMMAAVALFECHSTSIRFGGKRHCHFQCPRLLIFKYCCIRQLFSTHAIMTGSANLLFMWIMFKPSVLK